MCGHDFALNDPHGYYNVYSCESSCASNGLRDIGRMECEETLKSTFYSASDETCRAPGTNTALCADNEVTLGTNAVDVLSILRHYRYGTSAFLDWETFIGTTKSFTEWSGQYSGSFTLRARLDPLDGLIQIVYPTYTKTIRPGDPYFAFEDVLRYIHFDDTLTAEDYIYVKSVRVRRLATIDEAASPPPPASVRRRRHPSLPMNKPKVNDTGAGRTFDDCTYASALDCDAASQGGFVAYRLPRFSKTFDLSEVNDGSPDGGQISYTGQMVTGHQYGTKVFPSPRLQRRYAYLGQTAFEFRAEWDEAMSLLVPRAVRGVHEIRMHFMILPDGDAATALRLEMQCSTDARKAWSVRLATDAVTIFNRHAVHALPHSPRQLRQWHGLTVRYDMEAGLAVALVDGVAVGTIAHDPECFLVDRLHMISEQGLVFLDDVEHAASADAVHDGNAVDASSVFASHALPSSTGMETSTNCETLEVRGSGKSRTDGTYRMVSEDGEVAYLPQRARVRPVALDDDRGRGRRPGILEHRADQDPDERQVWVLTEAKYVGHDLQWKYDTALLTLQSFGTERWVLHDWVLFTKFDATLPPYVDYKPAGAEQLRFHASDIEGRWLQLEGNRIYSAKPQIPAKFNGIPIYALDGRDPKDRRVYMLQFSHAATLSMSCSKQHIDYDAQLLVCNNDCSSAFDGTCDDRTTCLSGSDCSDCGIRRKVIAPTIEDDGSPADPKDALFHSVNFTDYACAIGKRTYGCPCPDGKPLRRGSYTRQQRAARSHPGSNQRAPRAPRLPSRPDDLQRNAGALRHALHGTGSLPHRPSRASTPWANMGATITRT